MHIIIANVALFVIQITIRCDAYNYIHVMMYVTKHFFSISLLLLQIGLPPQAQLTVIVIPD